MRRLKSLYGDSLKILTLSVHEEYFVIKQMLENGSDGYVSKGVSARELFEAIKSVNSVGYFLSNRVQNVVNKNRLNQEDRIKFNESELAIIALIFKEYSNVQIASELNISKNTIATYRTRILNKVGVKNTVGLILYALRTGICALPTEE